MKAGRRYITATGKVTVRIHPLWALVRYPVQNLADLWYSLPNIGSWYRHGNWRYSVRTLPGEHAEPGQLAVMDQNLAALRDHLRGH